MMLLPSKRTHNYRRQGFTLIETIVALAVLGLFFAAISIILQQVLYNVGESRVRATAMALAQQKMEVVRNLAFSAVGTTGGIPQGPLLQTENVTINGLTFTVGTSVQYMDDPFDSIAPTDLINTDYKRARVEITWSGAYPSRIPVTFVTNIAPKGVETIVGGGTLFVQVFNANGLPVSNATITIDNTSVTPEIHTQTLTNANGLAVIPGAPACVNCYNISATKSSYSTDRTYTTAEVANPILAPSTVADGQVTQISFAIDQISSVSVTSVGPSPNYSPVPNVLFTIRGAKIIGYTLTDDPVYKYQYATNTGGSTVGIPNLEWDTYTLDFTSSAHNLGGSNPNQPISLTPGSSQSITVVAVPKTNTSLLVAVKNSGGILQASASAELSNTGLGFNVSKYTASTGSADYGQAFFGGLTPATYALVVSLPGYTDATASVVLNSIHQENVTLSPF